MPTLEQGSPGAKIRDWLFRAESTAKPKSIRAQARNSKRDHTAPLATKSPTRSLDSSHYVRVKESKKHATHDGKLLRQESPFRRIRHESRPFNLDQLLTDEQGPKSKHHTYQVADRPTLQGSLGASENDPRPTLETNRSRKRQRTHLSASTDQQSACMADLDCITSVGNHVRYGHAAEDTLPTERIMRGVAVSEVSHRSPLFFSSPKQPAGIYERRKRRKTHKDRYDVSLSKNEQKKLQVRSTRGQKPVKARRHKEKSGGALMQDFTAPNVVTDRLTLKPGKTVGLFGRGKASSPVKRRGLPDLAFSEFAFLNTTRCKATEEAASATKEEIRKAMKVKKAADVEAAISHYFIAGKSKNAGNVEPIDDLGHPTERQQGNLHDSVQTTMDLPRKPFLGFGTKGNTPISSVITVKEPDAKRVNSMSQRDTRSPSRSTSYFTWSRSNSPLSASEHRSGAPRSRPLEVAVGHRSSHSKSQSPLSGASMSSHNDRLRATPPKQAMHTIGARALLDDVINDADAISRGSVSPLMNNAMNYSTLQDMERVHGSRVRQSPDLDHLPFSKAFQLRRSILGTAETNGRIASDSNVLIGAQKSTAAVLPQHDADKRVLNTTQSAPDALLLACKPKLRDPSTRKPECDAEANTDELSTTAPCQRDQLDQKSRKRLTSPQSEPENGFQPVPHIHDASLLNTVDRAGYGHEHGQHMLTTKSEPTHDLYVRPRAMDVTDLRNPAIQTLRRSPLNALTACDSPYRYFRTQSPNHPESYALDIEDHIYGQLQNVEGHEFSHAFTSPEEIIPAYDFRQDQFDDDVAQDHFADNLKTYPVTMGSHYQRAYSRPNMAATEWATEHHLPMLGAPSCYSGTREPLHPRTSKVTQHLEFEVDNRPQTSRSNASLVDGFLVTPLARARVRNTPQVRPASWTRDGNELEPVGFWKPNRLY